MTMLARRILIVESGWRAVNALPRIVDGHSAVKACAFVHSVVWPIGEAQFAMAVSAGEHMTAGDVGNEPSASGPEGELLCLSAPETASTSLLDVSSGETIRLDHLGPLIGALRLHSRPCRLRDVSPDRRLTKSGKLAPGNTQSKASVSCPVCLTGRVEVSLSR